MGSAKLVKETASAIRNLTVSVTEASEATGKHAETIRRWISDGKLTASRLGDDGWFTIKVTDLADSLGLDLDELASKIAELRKEVG